MNKLISVTILTLSFASFSIYRFIEIQAHHNNYLEITFLDVGQGDAMLIKTPQNNYGLIDTGKNNSLIPALQEVMPYQNHLDFVILTHADADHIENIISLRNSYSIKTLFINYTSKSNSLIDEITHNINNIQTFGLENDTDFIFDEITIDIVWPTDEYSELTESLDANDASISFVLSYNNFSLFNGGDISLDIENELVAQINDIDVLKAGHHGSRTSTSRYFIEQTKPEVVIISAGKDNPFGHPHDDVIQNIRTYTDVIYQTAVHGNVQIQSDGRTYSMPHTKTEVATSKK